MMSKKSPQLRFEGFTDDWEERKLGDVGNTFTGLTGKTKEDFGHGSAKFVTYVNVFQNPIATLDQHYTQLLFLEYLWNHLFYYQKCLDH